MKLKGFFFVIPENNNENTCFHGNSRLKKQLFTLYQLCLMHSDRWASLGHTVPVSLCLQTPVKWYLSHLLSPVTSYSRCVSVDKIVSDLSVSQHQLIPPCRLLSTSLSSCQPCRLSLAVTCLSAGSNTVNCCQVSLGKLQRPSNIGASSRSVWQVRKTDRLLPTNISLSYISLSLSLQVADFVESLPGCEGQSKQFKDEVRRPLSCSIIHYITSPCSDLIGSCLYLFSKSTGGPSSYSPNGT